MRELLMVAGAVASGLSGAAMAQPVFVRVDVRSLAPQNDVSFAPLRVGFNAGVFDSFNAGQAATAPIISIAEGGSGSDWFPAFAGAEPQAVLGTVGAGPLLPGAHAFGVFLVDPAVNPYFTFASMVVPSNDHFIGNDNPQAYRLFDAGGQLVLNSISQRGSQVWDAGSELTDPMAAAFLVGGTNSLRTPQNGVVAFDFNELNAYNGLQTAAGYTFQRQFGASDEIYRITFTVVPAPASAGLLVLGGLLASRRRR